MRPSPLLFFALLAPTLVLAAPLRIALHPLTVVGGEGTENDTLQAIFASKVIALGAEPVASDEVARYVTAHGPCTTDTCLGQLAAATHAQRALAVSISPYSPRIVMSGRLVSASGVLVRELAGRSYAKHGSRSVADAFAAFLHELDLDTVEPVALTPSPAPVVEAPPRTVAPPAPVALATPPPAVAPTSPHPTLRLASYLAAGAGAAALLTSGAIALSAHGDRDRLQSMLDATGNRPPTPEAQSLDSSLASRSKLSTALAISGGVALAGGAALFWFSRPSSPKVALVIDGSSAALAVTGSF
jgi:hypothetical protein